MLTPSIIRDIEKLLEEGNHSRRKIAERVGVARGTVTAVALGIRETDDYLEHVPEYEKSGEIRRCPGCGATVQMPCTLCQTRDMVAGNRLQSRETILETPLGLNLKPEHQERYAEVRRWRREALRLGIIITPHYDSE